MMLMMAYDMGVEICSAEWLQLTSSSFHGFRCICLISCLLLRLPASQNQATRSLSPPPDHLYRTTSLPETSEWMTIWATVHEVIMKMFQGLGLHPCLFGFLPSHHLQNTGHLRLHVCWEMDDVCLYFDRTHIQSLGIKGCNNSWVRIIQW